MKAVQVTRFGAPDVLAVTDLPDPTPGPGQVAIDVTHAAVGLIDVYIRQGLYKDREGLPQPPYVPGLEVAGTVRALGDGVTGFAVGEKVVALSADATGGYASVHLSDQTRVVSTQGYDIDPALAVAVVPNAIMAHVALTRAITMSAGESILIHGALGALAAAFPGIARQLGASRVVGTVRTERMGAAAATKLPYDAIVDSAELSDALGGEKFDVIIDPVGGAVRTQSLDLLAPSGRLLLVGNASGDWTHRIDGNQIWYSNVVVAGFNAGVYLPAHPDAIGPAAEAALTAVAAGLADTEIEVLPLTDASTAHERLENHTANGRIVLTP
ncbi:NADPH:quinone reductase [Microtetraspora sp. NBRC 13810]|uniref:quinone oxidoreductase family protein n=1 Tax=Microtetraspora sp. NBRC 13810 TaxID=3030990 RepID=UPI0024A22415|nr:zinc-binding dehydrogenase [Microtetraspora sp. NBRC 13810]GLW11760.1 NADPH:quinone reductase [Microtetraspora sp. NBRC 13810]